MKCRHCEVGEVSDYGSVRGQKRYICKSCGKTSFYLAESEDEKDNVISLNSGRILSLDDLLAGCRVDPDVWAVDHFIANKWDVGAKGADGKVVVEQLFQIKAWLKRKISKYIVSPVKISISGLEGVQENRTGNRVAMVLCDSQNGYVRDLKSGDLLPFHDRKAWDIAIQLAKKVQPDVIVLAGDMLDLAEWSDKFIRSPEFYFTTQPALIELAWWIGNLRKACPGARIAYIEGNHESRLSKAVTNNLVSAQMLEVDGEQVLSLDHLLGLRGAGVEYVGNYPKNELWLAESLKVVHGDTVRGGAGDTVKAIIREAAVSVICGHVHRFEAATKTVHVKDGRSYISVASAPALCRNDGAVPSKGGENNWQQGILLVNYGENPEDFSVVPVFIIEGRASYGKDRFIGEDRTGELGADTGWRF